VIRARVRCMIWRAPFAGHPPHRALARSFACIWPAHWDGGASRTAEVRAAQERAAQLRASSVRLAGEPLHFRSDSTGMTALAAAPIDSAAGVTLELRCGDEPAEQVRIATQAGAYRLERLRVAPRFAASPDSVLAARLRREAESAAAVSRGAHDTPRLFTAPFLAPRVSRVTSGFGGGRTFNGIVTSRHMGVDYQGAVGAPVRAANRGVVRLIGTFYLGGNVIYIDHGDGLVTAYLHLSRQLVAAGDTVARGAIIGRVGATGARDRAAPPFHHPLWAGDGGSSQCPDSARRPMTSSDVLRTHDAVREAVRDPSLRAEVVARVPLHYTDWCRRIARPSGARACGVEPGVARRSSGARAGRRQLHRARPSARRARAGDRAAAG
jgi:hypothetical protein